MKLVTHRTARGLRHGAVVGDQIVDFLAALAHHEGSTEGEAASRHGADLLGFIERAERSRPVIERALERAADLPPGALSPLASADLLSPLPRPSSLRDGYAFRQHVESARRNRGLPMIPEFDDFPVFYFSNHGAVIGPGPLAVRPMQRDRLDFELEGAIVVGKGGRDVKASEADAHVFGYLVMNDWSARAVQMEEMKLSLGPAKGKDFATGLGPFLVTCDELASARTTTPRGDRYDLAMRAWVNGKLLSEGNLSQMHYTFAEILERVSYGATLYPGDVIGSGTVGTGCLLELNGSKITDNQWLQPGDHVALEIDRLGRLENTIVAAE
jgi:fumarylacetoacetate (FAA) hydrolase